MTTLIRPPVELVPLGLSAMKTVALAAGELRPGARRLVEAAQRIFLGTNIDIDTVQTTTPEAFADGFRAPIELRQQFVRGLCVLSLVDGAPDERVTHEVRRFAKAVGVEEPALRPLELFAEGQMLLGKLDYLRRSNIRGMLEGELEKGLVRFVKSTLGQRGLYEDPLIAAPFLALEDLPAGTLGRALFDHYREHGFHFPGERGGFPEAGVYHDITHVLSGYGTDPYGELRVGAFTAGYRKQDPFFVALLPLLLFVAEINVTPLPHDHADALFAQPGVAEAYLHAMERGGGVMLDLSDHWDFWPLMRRPIDDARRELGIAPDTSSV
jgi:hypothetical protein